jgi:hypothetical protein
MFIYPNQVAQQPQWQPEEIYCLRYEYVGNDPVFTSWNDNDFSHGVENVLRWRGYTLLPGSSQLLSTYQTSTAAGPRFIVVVRIYHCVFVVSIPDIVLYHRFMSIHSPSESVAPLRKSPVKTALDLTH